MQSKNGITPSTVCKSEKNLQTMKAFATTLAIAKRDIDWASLFIQLDWTDDHETNTLD